jgi:hypothetical protein
MDKKFEYKRASDSLSEEDRKLLDVAEGLSFALPKYKAENFVGGAQITPYAKLRQWLMELRTREDAAEHIEYLLRKKEIEIELEHEKMEFVTEPLRKELVELGIKDMHIDLRKYQRNLKDAYRERQIFVDLIKDFLSSEDGKLPDGRSLMEIFSNQLLEDKYEREYWSVRMAKQAMLDMISYGRVGTGNLDSILMMSPQQQQEVMSLAASYTVTIDKNINELMGRAATNQNQIEDNLKDQFKIGTTKDEINEKLL